MQIVIKTQTVFLSNIAEWLFIFHKITPEEKVQEDPFDTSCGQERPNKSIPLLTPVKSRETLPLNTAF
jgi:hypothetical protein